MSHTPSFSPWWLSPILTAALAGLGALYMNKSTTTSDLLQRTSMLEAHQIDMTSRLDRIELKLDKIVDAMGVK